MIITIEEYKIVKIILQLLDKPNYSFANFKICYMAQNSLIK